MVLGEKKVLAKAREDGLALTFDDVRLKTGYSEVLPQNVSTKTMFSKNVPLNIPIVSAAMDTVTGARLAIELAKLGGLGIIHRNLNPEAQAKQVAKVKHHLNGRIDNPIFMFEDDTIADIIKKKDEKAYSFTSFPIVDREGRLTGILTGNDFEFCTDSLKLARDVMSTGLLTASSDTTVEQAHRIMQEKKKKVLPLIDEYGFLKGMYVFSDVNRIITRSAEMYNVDSGGRLRVGAAVGVGEEALLRVKLLVEKGVDVIVIDTAHGDSAAVLQTLKEIKSKFSVDVVAGNISTAESAMRLIHAGADGIKIGQGPGSICTTRIIAGIGKPQVSAVYECALIAEKFGIPVCADGGMKYSGDIPIAIAAGANSVMMGSMLAGTEEAPGDVVFVNGRQWKSYRGMGSLGAMESNQGSRERYHQSAKANIVPEGVEGLVPYKGKLADVIFQYIEGFKRGMGYVGAKNISELQEKGEFDRITSSGLGESHPHDIKITRDAPNYSTGEEGTK